MVLNANQSILLDQINEFGDLLNELKSKRKIDQSEKENAQVQMVKFNKSSLDESVNVSMLVKSDFPWQLDVTGGLIFDKLPNDLLNTRSSKNGIY